MKINKEITNRNFVLLTFQDLYNRECSIQESSLATDNAIWIGTGETRMHLNQEQVQEILPILERFVKNGNLSGEMEDEVVTEFTDKEL